MFTFRGSRKISYTREKNVKHSMTVGTHLNVAYLGSVGTLVSYRGKEEKMASFRKAVLQRITVFLVNVVYLGNVGSLVSYRGKEGKMAEGNLVSAIHRKTVLQDVA